MVACLAVGPVRGPARGPARGAQRLRLLLVACLAWGLAPRQSAPRQSAPVLAPVLAKVPHRRPTVAAGLVLGPVQK